MTMIVILGWMDALKMMLVFLLFQALVMATSKRTKIRNQMRVISWKTAYRP